MNENNLSKSTYLKDFASLEEACVLLISESKEDVESDFAALLLLKHEAVRAARGPRRWRAALSVAPRVLDQTALSVAQRNSLHYTIRLHRFLGENRPLYLKINNLHQIRSPTLSKWGEHSCVHCGAKAQQFIYRRAGLYVNVLRKCTRNFKQRCVMSLCFSFPGTK